MDRRDRKNELRHFGVLGMKWGVRRDDRVHGHKSSKDETEVDRKNTPLKKQALAMEGSKNL